MPQGWLYPVLRRLATRPGARCGAGRWHHPQTPAGLARPAGPGCRLARTGNPAQARPGAVLPVA
jgi:hypothetical protein